MLAIDIYTDGANGGRNGTPGGWAAILMTEGGFKLAISGYDPSTSNNRMELTATIRGLEAVGKERAMVTIYTDSAYVKNAHTQGWLEAWQRNGWKSYRGDPVANQDLWAELIDLVKLHLVKWRKVRGHGNSVFNNAVDALAVAAKKQGHGVTTIS